MPIVEFKLGEQKFELLCEAGQQTHIKVLASAIDVRMQELAKTFRGTSDHLLLAITALMMEDELRGLRENIDKSSASSGDSSHEDVKKIENFLNNTVLPVAMRIEQLAEKLEKM